MGGVGSVRRTAGELSLEFGSSAESIRNWVRQSGREQEGIAEEVLTPAEREVLLRLGGRTVGCAKSGRF